MIEFFNNEQGYEEMISTSAYFRECKRKGSLTEKEHQRLEPEYYQWLLHQELKDDHIQGDVMDQLKDLYQE